MPKDVNALIERNMVYARNVALKIAKNLPKPPGFDQEDIIQVGYQGLIQAAQRFDPAQVKGTNIEQSFRNYAYTRISGAVIDECRRLTFVKRRGLEKGAKVQMTQLDHEFEDDEGNVLTNYILTYEDDPYFSLDLQEALGSLDEVEQQIIAQMISGYSAREISKSMGLHISKVSEIGTAAKEKLANCLDT